MDDAQLFERMQSSLLAFIRLIPAGSARSQVIERDGLAASVVPSAPDRSVFNSVAYRSPQNLSDALDELAGIYAQEEVRAWTVWVPERDREVAGRLEHDGHALDADPMAMAMELEGFDLPSPEEIELDPDPGVAAIAHMNDVAYGYDSDFVHALSELPKEAAYRYVALVDGSPAAGLMTVDSDGDCLITFVATLPEARGRGLATALMTCALLDARERGCTTTTLQATKMGQPVYERLGYRGLGALQMWERRQG